MLLYYCYYYYRDPHVREYLTKLKSTKPVIFSGDLNVAHLDLDIHNPSAKHIVKQAGLTPQERQSFGKLLECGFKDALRYFYPGKYCMYNLHVDRLSHSVSVTTVKGCQRYVGFYF